MFNFIFVFVFAFIFIIAFILFKVLLRASNKSPDKNSQMDDELKYQSIDFLLSKAERSFYGVLCESLGDNYDIFSKVRVADIIKPAKGVNKSQFYKLFNKISKKHFDFVICDKNTVKILCVVELDDSSHDSKVRKKRDDFLVLACKSADMPFVQVVCRRSYNISEIKNKILQSISSVKINQDNCL